MEILTALLIVVGVCAVSIGVLIWQISRNKNSFIQNDKPQKIVNEFKVSERVIGLNVTDGFRFGFGFAFGVFVASFLIGILVFSLVSSVATEIIEDSLNIK